MLGRKRRSDSSINRGDKLFSDKSPNEKQSDKNEDKIEKSEKVDKFDISSNPILSKSPTPTQIDIKVKEDLSKNIKINININVNNNTSNTLNITTIGKKLGEDSESGTSESDFFNDEDPIEVLKDQIDSLLFYKIDMTASSRDRLILSTLENIQSRLIKLKNCNVYNVI